MIFMKPIMSSHYDFIKLTALVCVRYSDHTQIPIKDMDIVVSDIMKFMIK